jgi:outer membrane biosynthesis protein TonB
MDFDQIREAQAKRTFMQRYGIYVGVGVLVLAVVLIFAGKDLFGGGSSSSRKAPEVTMLRLPPLPPPPPPPPPPKVIEQKVEQKMVEQEKVDDNQEKPDDKPPEAAPALSTNLTGGGGPDFGLAHSGGGNTLGGSRRSGGGKWGWYASKVQGRIGDALRQNPKTKTASMNITVRIWPDPVTGRVTKAKITGSTGSPEVDRALQEEILQGLQLDEPPPAGMPAPIVMRINARRPQ